MSGTSYENFPVNVGDQVSIMGGVVSVTGSAPSTASVVVAEISDGAQFTCQANDCTSVQHTSGEAMSMDGKLFTTGNRVTVNGLVKTVTGTGLAAQLSVKLDHSGLVVTVSAGSVHSNAA